MSSGIINRKLYKIKLWKFGRYGNLRILKLKYDVVENFNFCIIYLRRGILFLEIRIYVIMNDY